MAPEHRNSTHCAEHGVVAAGISRIETQTSEILKELKTGAVTFAQHDGKIKAVEQSGILTRRLLLGLIGALVTGAGIALAAILR